MHAQTAYHIGEAFFFEISEGIFLPREKWEIPFCHRSKETKHRLTKATKGLTTKKKKRKEERTFYSQATTKKFFDFCPPPPPPFLSSPSAHTVPRSHGRRNFNASQIFRFLPPLLLVLIRVGEEKSNIFWQASILGPFFLFSSAFLRIFPFPRV